MKISEKRNDSQKRAIAHLSGPMMVLAGPGSGKTSVIVERTEYLVRHHQAAPSSILVVTFSRAAAREMRERFLAAQNPPVHGVTFGTFHSVFYGILKLAYHLDSSNIIRPEMKNQFLKELASDYCPDLKDERDFLEDIASEISLVKGSRLQLDHYYSANCPAEAFRRIFQGYVSRCRRQRLMDFDDMLVQCYELLSGYPEILKAWQEKFRYILVDEFQDINQLQYDIVRMLAAPEDNLFIVGDDDQSIYHFRGARPEIMLNFKKDYPQAETVVLNINYRCTDYILRTASNLIGHNEKRYQKKLSTPNAQGNKVKVTPYQDPYEEAVEICKKLAELKKEGEDLSGTAILTRTNMESAILVEKLMEYQLPFLVRDRLPNLFDHWIARDLMAYLEMAKGDMSRQHFLTVMNRPNRYISREAVYEAEVDFEELLFFYEDKDWMCDRIDRLRDDLGCMRSMSPFAAINYVRHAVGYEEYLRDYALSHSIRPEELLEILDRIQASARSYKTLEEWKQHIESYIQEMKESQHQQEDRQGVTIATLHSSKGLEFDRVYIVNVNEGIIPYKKAQFEAQIEEERRLFYVGMTRAKKELHLCYTYRQFDKKMERSRFLDELLS